MSVPYGRNIYSYEYYLEFKICCINEEIIMEFLNKIIVILLSFNLIYNVHSMDIDQDYNTGIILFIYLFDNIIIQSFDTIFVNCLF